MEITLDQIATVAGNAGITAILSELFWRTSGASGATRDRFGPIAAVTTGVVLALAAAGFLATTAVGRADIGAALLVGLQGGLMSMGIHDVWTTRAGVAVSSGCLALVLALALVAPVTAKAQASITPGAGPFAFGQSYTTEDVVGSWVPRQGKQSATFQALP